MFADCVFARIVVLIAFSWLSAGCSSKATEGNAPPEIPAADAEPTGTDRVGEDSQPPRVPAVATEAPAPVAPHKQENADASVDGDLVVRLQAVDKTGYQAVLNRHRGRVVLVDCWATWCGPCRKQFPHSVTLSRKYTETGLSVVSLCFDDPDNAAQVLEFLQQQQASFDNLLSQYGGPQAMEAFDIEGGALPHYKLFNRQGQLAATFSLDPAADVQFTTDDIEAKIIELLTGG